MGELTHSQLEFWEPGVTDPCLHFSFHPMDLLREKYSKFMNFLFRTEGSYPPPQVLLKWGLLKLQMKQCSMLLHSGMASCSAKWKTGMRKGCSWLTTSMQMKLMHLLDLTKEITTQQLFVHEQINRQVYVWMDEEMGDRWIEGWNSQIAFFVRMFFFSIISSAIFSWYTYWNPSNGTLKQEIFACSGPK